MALTPNSGGNAVEALLNVLAAASANHGRLLDALDERLVAVEALAGEQAAALAWAAEMALAALDGSREIDEEHLAAARRVVNDWTQRWSLSPTSAPTN